MPSAAEARGRASQRHRIDLRAVRVGHEDELIEACRLHRPEHAHGAGDAMVEHSADVMLYHLGKADVVGRLGGAEFAIVLVGAGEAVASEKAVWLGKLLMNQLLIQGGLEVPQVVSIAARPLDPTEEPEAALAKSDRDASP